MKFKDLSFTTQAVLAMCVGVSVAMLIPKKTTTPTCKIVTTNYVGITPPSWVPTNRFFVTNDSSYTNFVTNDSWYIDHRYFIVSNKTIFIITSNIPPGFRIEYK